MNRRRPRRHFFAPPRAKTPKLSLGSAKFCKTAPYTISRYHLHRTLSFFSSSKRRLWQTNTETITIEMNCLSTNHSSFSSMAMESSNDSTHSRCSSSSMTAATGTSPGMSPTLGWMVEEPRNCHNSQLLSSGPSESISVLERASKRLRLSSPPRPSLMRRFGSNGSPDSAALDEDPSIPPDIQRLALPSLLHARHLSRNNGAFPESCSSLCPFGTMS